MTLLQSKRSQHLALWVIWTLSTIKIVGVTLLFADVIPDNHLKWFVAAATAIGLVTTKIARLLPRNKQLLALDYQMARLAIKKDK